MHEPITTAICAIPAADMLRLVEEDPPEVVAVGEDLGLQRQERAAGVDEVDARQAVLLGDLLRAQVLLHGQREVGAALHGRVVREEDTRLSLHHADAGDDPGRRRLTVVELPGREGAELEERRARVDEPVDTLARGHLPAGAVALDRGGAAAERNECGALSQLRDERLHPRLRRANSSAFVSTWEVIVAMVGAP